MAKESGSTVSVVRRIVGKQDRKAIDLKTLETAQRINALPLDWRGKAEAWKTATQTSETTFWRALKRLGAAGKKPAPMKRRAHA